MRISVYFTTFMLICLLFGQTYAQNDFDVNSPTEEDIFLFAQAQKGDALALIPNGETLTSLENLKKGGVTWHKVKWGEYTGYVDAKYLVESTGRRKGFVSYQSVNITKLVLIHATSSTEGLCYLISVDNKTQQVKVKNRFRCKFGISGIMKQKEGDKKTPLGHYCVTSESSITNDLTITEDDEIYNKFGGYNIHLNYPNVHDSKEKKTGGGICIHGGYSRPTEGCVRIIDEGQEVSTKNIITVGNFVTKGTHVIITNTLPPTFKQKSNTFLQPESYSFIQTACSEIRSHNDWKAEVDKFLNPTPTSYGPTGPVENPFVTKPPVTAPSPSPVSTPKPTSQPAGFVSAYVKSSTGFANLRQKPNQDAKILERIPSNERITYKDNGTSWWEVISEKGSVGYMYKSLIVK